MRLSQPVRKEIPVTRSRILKAAYYEDVPTGEIQEIPIIGVDGVRRIEERPITDRVFHEATRKDVTNTKEVWEVRSTPTGPDDKTPVETHQFSNEADAKRFLEDSR